MKRLIASITASLSLMLLATVPAAAANSAQCALQLSNPGVYNNGTGKYYMTNSTFNVQYTLLSTAPADFMVQLYEDGSPYGSAVPSRSDPQSAVGNSGTVSVVTTTDGSHSFSATASATGENCSTTNPVSVVVDTHAPGAPHYGGKTQAGTTYTITFTAPGDSDVNIVKVFTSTSKTYTADASNQIAAVSVTANDAKTFTWTAPDLTTRYFSVEAFDAAGNGSAVVGDPGTVVHPVVTTTGGGTATTAAATTNGTAAAGGQTQGASTTQNGSAGSNGNINASGSGTTNKNKSSNNKGKVLGAATTSHSTRNAIFTIIGIIVVGAAILYYIFFTRRDKSLLPRK